MAPAWHCRTTRISTAGAANGSLRASTTTTQSANTLTKTTVVDEDGDGLTDWSRSDVTTIVSGQRTETATVTNRDASTKSMEKTVLGADKVTTKSWSDLDQDGIFEATDVVSDVTVNATTGLRTAFNWSRNADGSVASSLETRTSSDGLNVASFVDEDGDGDVDTRVSDVTVKNASGTSTRTVETFNGNGSLRSRSITDVTADGLTSTTTEDINGDGSFDGRMTTSIQLNVGGSVTRTETDRAGDGLTVLSVVMTVESEDRLSKTISTDADGDGNVDQEVVSVEAADGSKTVTTTRFNPDGTVAALETQTVSANGLVVTTTVDADADGLNESVTTDTTVYNANGSTTQTIDTDNGDGSMRGRKVTTVSDDGLVVTNNTDLNGNGAFERTVTSRKVLDAVGSATTTKTVTAYDGSLLSQTQTIVSDDTLVTTVKRDRDGDGVFELTQSTTRSLQANGSVSTVIEVRDQAGALRSRETDVVSDDGRLRTGTADINGDGIADRFVTDVVSDNGTKTTTEEDRNASGTVQDRRRETTSDDGLISVVETDADGDGIFEEKITSTTVLNSDGSRTTTENVQAPNGGIVSKTILTESDDGLSSTLTEDWNNDGAVDVTTISSRTIEQDGDQVESTVRKAADSSNLSTRTIATAADRRTVTDITDLDGNGHADVTTSSIEGQNGAVTRTTSHHSSGGVVHSTRTEVVSSDGLLKTMVVDSNADGEAELVVSDLTEVGENGYVSQTVNYRDDRYVQLGRAEYLTSDTGLYRQSILDLDGDGIIDFRTEDTTTYPGDGSIVQIVETRDNTSALQSRTATSKSGDGLQETITVDFDGDGNNDRRTSAVEGAGGGQTTTVEEFSPAYHLQRSSTLTVSADGRSSTEVLDRDGDGFADRTIETDIDLSSNKTSIVSELNRDGSTAKTITTVISANQADQRTEIDFDGDGYADIFQHSVISYLSDGSEQTRLTQSGANGALFYAELKTASANGLSTIVDFDMDGDGTSDGTTTSVTTLNADGSKQTLSETRYEDGELRSSTQTFISADGRTIEESADYNGNGIADKVVITQHSSDGGTVVTESTFNESGQRKKSFVTTTSADGLTTSIVRSGNEQTVTRSPTNNDSYTWDNGETASETSVHIVSSHRVDVQGFDTWTLKKTWVVQDENNRPQEVRETQTIRLDPSAKARVFSEAEAIFDAVLDRDLDFVDYETLADLVTNGQLDASALTDRLIGSSEFSTRYGTLNDAEFVTQAYLNTYGRAPSLAELHQHLNDLSGTTSRTELSVELALSAEHLMAGNGHRLTNNFDVIMNPALFERPLDKAYVRSLVMSIVDVVYDREATEYELEYCSRTLLEDDDNPDDIAAALLDYQGAIQGISLNSLYGLSGAALVEQAFVNGLGRQPTAEEQSYWVENLNQELISSEQFVASVAMSIEHRQAGNSHGYHGVVAPNSVTGTAAADTLSGGAGADLMSGLGGADTLDGNTGSDVLVGGSGNDTLIGDGGNDTYRWAKGDGNDTITDSVESLIETDRLVLSNVLSNDVQLYRTTGSLHLISSLSPPTRS